jgi:hypothetical protein
MNFEHSGNRWVGLLLVALCLQLTLAQNPARTLTTIDRKPYLKWLNEDVRYIITDQERTDFKKLTLTSSVTVSSKRSGHVATPTPACQQTHSRRNTTAGSPVLTCTLEVAIKFPDGGQTEGASISCGDPQTPLIQTPFSHHRQRPGITPISKILGETLPWYLMTSAVAEIIH